MKGTWTGSQQGSTSPFSAVLATSAGTTPTSSSLKIPEKPAGDGTAEGNAAASSAEAGQDGTSQTSAAQQALVKGAVPSTVGSWSGTISQGMATPASPAQPVKPRTGTTTQDGAAAKGSDSTSAAALASVQQSLPVQQSVVVPVTLPVGSSLSPLQDSSNATATHDTRSIAPVSGDNESGRTGSGSASSTSGSASGSSATSSSSWQGTITLTGQDAASSSAPTGAQGAIVAEGSTPQAMLPAEIFLPQLNLNAADLNATAMQKGSGNGAVGKATDLASKGPQTSTQNSGQASGSSSGTGAANNDGGASGILSQNSQSGNQTGSQSGQHMAGDPSVAGAGKPPDMSAAPMQPVPMHATANDTPGADRAQASAGTAHATEAQAASVPGESEAAGGINTAKVIQSMGETEMRVGMRSEEFGNISIRTSVSQQQMMTQISVDHGELGRAISAHIPSVQARLGDDFGVRASIEVTQSGASFSGERQASQEQQTRTFAFPAPAGSATTTTESESQGPRGLTALDHSDRLDIQA